MLERLKGWMSAIVHRHHFTVEHHRIDRERRDRNVTDAPFFIAIARYPSSFTS